MKRYFYFLRSLATVSFPIFVVLASLFMYSSASAEELGSQNPECITENVYAEISIPDSLVVVLGNGEVVESGVPFLIFENGVGFNENEADITVSYDVSIIRTGTTIFINVGVGVLDGEGAIQQIVDSLVLSGGNITSSNIFSGNVAVVEFQADDCPEDVCLDNGPMVVSIEKETVYISENSSFSENEILNLFGVLVEDLDGEGEVTISSDLESLSYQTEGVYTITITLTDNEGCTQTQTLSLAVQAEENNGGGGSRRSGTCTNPEGCGGVKKQDEPQGEVLGATTCAPYLSTFIQMGEKNLKSDVEKLQTFLNQYMGESLEVDGVYGPKTFEAVKRFQTKEFDEILKPWGITEPTGIVRETTLRRINNIMCPELNIAMPVLYCATTGNLLYPDGSIVDPNPEYILYNGEPVVENTNPVNTEK